MFEQSWKFCVIALVGGCVVARAEAQAAMPACGAPPVVSAQAQANIFSEQQEEWLGEAMADRVEREYPPAKNAAQNAYLQAIADKLAGTVPEAHIPFRVKVIDSSEVNGFSLAGGHIYITRKLAASAESDDELASVIGHEMGHIASHQFAFETTSDLKRLLGVTAVGDKADIYEKFQKLTEARMLDKHPTAGDSDDKQDEADKVGVYMIAAAGYRPLATPEFWDRMFYTQGKTGGRFSDFFGISKPSERRLGRMKRMAAALPAGCGGSAPVLGAGFTEWHRLVVENRRATNGHVEGVKEVRLSPPLRMDLNRLRFSPDGKMLLAQDESTIYGISKEPLAVQFRMDAEDALPAEFSPDSQQIVFGTQGLHVERWSVGEKKLIAASEPRSKQHCLQARLSPDGRTVSCLQQNYEAHSLDLALLDAQSGAVLWQKNHFFEPSIFFDTLMALTTGEEWVGDYVPSSFSADGNFLLIGPGDAKLAFDLRTRTPVKLGGDLRSDVTGKYAFVGSDRVAGVNATSPKDSGVFSFPDGKRLEKVSMPFEKVRAVSGNDGSAYVVSDGIKNFELGLADLTHGRFVMGSQTTALDEWNGLVAGQSLDGAVMLFKLEDGKLTTDKRLNLPMSLLAAPHAVALSTDARYLALSTRDRGGVWDTKDGKEQVLSPGFQAVAWGEDGKLYAEFRKIGEMERHISTVTFPPAALKRMPYKVDDKTHLRYGLLIELKDSGKAGTEFIVHNLADGGVRWTKNLRDDSPGFTESAGGHDLLFSYSLQSKTAKERMKANGTLAGQLADVKQKDTVRLIEVVNTATGADEAEMMLQRPPDYAGVDGLNRVGDLLYVTGEANRTLVYSLKDGKQLRQVYGTLAAADLKGHRVCLLNRRDEAIVYDDKGKELAHVNVGSPLRFASFTPDGGQVLLLSADQVVRTMDVAEQAKP